MRQCDGLDGMRERAVSERTPFTVRDGFARMIPPEAVDIMRRLYIGVVIVCVSAGLVRAQEPPNFAGTWTRDADRSSSQGGGRGRGNGTTGGTGGGLALGPPADGLTVRQTATSLTVEERRGSTTSKVSYALDGSKVKNKIAAGKNAGQEAVYTSAWKDGRLVTTITLTPKGGGAPMPYQESRSLDPGGAMIVETTLAGQANARSVVYTKSR